MRDLHDAKKYKSLLAKLLILVLIFATSMPSLTAFAASDNTVSAYGYNINNKYQGSWSKGNLGPNYQEGEWVAFQTQVIQVDWENLTNLGVRFDFYDNDAIFYDLIRNISVGTELLPADHGFPNELGDPYVISDEASANTAQREPNEYIFNEFKKMDIPPSQLNVANDLTKGTITDNSRTFYVTKDQLIDAIEKYDEYDEDNLPTDIVLYFQLHLARTWIWNNTNGGGFALARSYGEISSPTYDWGGHIYNDPSFLASDWTALGSAAYPGSSGHSYVFINNGDSGEKTIPIPDIKETAGMISGHKYLDSNGNGVFDEGEPPLSNWEIFLRTDLYAIQNLEFSVRTDENGYFQFTNLPYNLIWELTEGEQAGYAQTYPNTDGTGAIPSPIDVENDYWKVPFDVSQDASYDLLNRGPWGWSVKLAPSDNLVQEDVDFLNANNGALLITKQFHAEEGYSNFPTSVTVKVTGPSYPEPDGLLITFSSSSSTGYGSTLVENLLAGVYIVTEVSWSGGESGRWDPPIDPISVTVSPGQVDPPAQVDINNYYIVYAGQIDGNKLDENELPLDNPIFEFEIYTDTVPPVLVAYANSSDTGGNFRFGTDSNQIDQDTLTLNEGDYFIREVNLPPEYEYVKMYVSDGINPTTAYFTVDVPFTVAARDQLLNFDVVNKLKPGGFNVTKLVENNGFEGDLSGVIFYFNVEGPNSYTNSFQLVNGQVESFNNLEPGDYVVTETDPGSHWALGTNPQTYTVLPGVDSTQAGTLTFTNTYQPGGFNVTKVVENNGFDGDLSGEIFYFNVVGPNGYTNSFQLVNGQVESFDNLEPGDYIVTETDPGGNWALGTNPQTYTVLPGVDSTQAGTLTFTNTYQPGDLRITKAFIGIVDGDIIPATITVRVTGPGGYDETHVIEINDVTGEVVITGLAPGIYQVFELAFEGSELWTSEIDASPVEVGPNQIDPPALVEIRNYRRMVEETAYAYPGWDDGLFVGGTLESIIMKNSNNWGWYLDASAVTDGSIFDVYAAAGQNDINNGKYVGTVTFNIEDEYYVAIFESDVFGVQVTDGPHFGVYESNINIPNSPGRYTNNVLAADANFIIFHIVVEYPME